MDTSEFDEFSLVIKDICTAFDRPYTDDRARVFWEDLKRYHLLDVKKTAAAYRQFGKKMPAPRDLIPERKSRPTAPPREDENKISPWGIAANKILMAVAYMDIRRGFKPMAVYEPVPEKGWGLSGWPPKPVSTDVFHAVMLAKAEYVNLAEVAEAEGEPWETVEFNQLCREGFEKLLGTTGRVSISDPRGMLIGRGA